MAAFISKSNNFGHSFGCFYPQENKNAGIEILLHNLSNPARSLTHIENNVTGRKVGDGTTNLVLDLKMRKMKNQDKLNYELNIGSRKFKCTTIPIFREEYGLIGAICINVDVNYITDHVLPSIENVEYFFEQLCKVDMKLDENILSKPEYDNALAGKRTGAITTLNRVSFSKIKIFFGNKLSIGFFGL